jgi:hypothetical protein
MFYDKFNNILPLFKNLSFKNIEMNPPVSSLFYNLNYNIIIK